MSGVFKNSDRRHSFCFEIHGAASVRELRVPGYVIVNAFKAVDFVLLHVRSVLVIRLFIFLHYFKYRRIRLQGIKDV